MQEELIHQTIVHAKTFFLAARLHKKKWYREIKDNDELLYSFFVIRRRMIQPKNYIIHESKQLHEKDIKPEVLRDYEALKKALKESGDLKKFHTENSKILFPIDSLLEEYNINHLHLDRSRYQIFFIADGDEIFMVNICKHFERNRTNHSKNNLLEIIGQNWPEKKNKKYFIEKNKPGERYPSAYGREKLEHFYAWINDICTKHNEKYLELTFTDNQKLVIRTKATHLTIPEIPAFEV